MMKLGKKSEAFLVGEKGLESWIVDWGLFISSKESPSPERAMVTEIGIQKERGSRYYLFERIEKKRTMESLILAQDER